MMDANRLHNNGFCTGNLGMARALSSWVPLLLLSIGVGFFLAAYVVSRSAVAQMAATVLVYVLPLFIIFWVLQDARQRRCVPCFDFGFLLFMAFPLSVVWYLFWTRGWKGLALLAAFVGLFLVPWMFAIFVFVVATVLRL
jgi:hypothetical protein